MESVTELPGPIAGGKLRSEERIYVASQWKLMWLHFRKHRLAVAGLVVVGLMYFAAIFHGFLAPYDKMTRSEFIFMPAQKLHFVDDAGKFTLRPFTYKMAATVDMAKMERVFTEDRTTKIPVRFFVRGDKWTFPFTSDLHLLGTDPGQTFFVMGTDSLGRDLFSRILFGASISLSIGLMGVLTSFLLGIVLGGISGYAGGVVDNTIQRIIEFLISVPTIPLWMALSASIPRDWPPTKVYFAITLILSLRGWCGLARIVRTKILQLREEDYVMASRLVASSDWQIIRRHLLPSTMSYLIVHMTLAVPGMILGETALSFLGLGLRPPVVSWGVLLQDTTNVGTVASRTWLMWPAVFVILTVLAFNFMGDGLRDAADPYKM
jgi:peptide/nickel transport system permease protein